MFDIGFWELLVIAIVLLLVMGPERLPEVARQAAFLVRKARQGMFRLRSEMQSEMDATPFADLQKARQEMTDLKNDFKQFGRELADSAEQKVEVDGVPDSASSGAKLKASDAAIASADGQINHAVAEPSEESDMKVDSGDTPSGPVKADDPVGSKP